MDTSGAAVERYLYEPYGRVTIYDDDWSDTRGTSSFSNEILSCGYRPDPESGLYHVRNRMYHCTLGRWMQRDPLEYVDGVSLYEYVGGNPANHADPTGLDEDDDSDPSDADDEDGGGQRKSSPLYEISTPAGERPNDRSIAGDIAGTSGSDQGSLTVHFLHSTATYDSPIGPAGHSGIGFEDKSGNMTVYDYVGRGNTYRRAESRAAFIASQAKAARPGQEFTVQDLTLNVPPKEATALENRMRTRSDLKWGGQGRGGIYGHNCTSSICEDMRHTTSIKPEGEVPGAPWLDRELGLNYVERWGVYTVPWLISGGYVIRVSVEKHKGTGGGYNPLSGSK